MHSMSIHFSIIMPCYNSSAYVAEATQSLLKQTYQNWELIAVNDGSKDNTLEILNQFASQDSRIKVFSKPNGGYASAINCGLDQVSGDYFLMMGSDDRLAETLFEELVNGISKNQELPDMIAFRALRFKNGAFFERDSMSAFESAAGMSNTSISEFEHQYPENAKIFFSRDTAKCFKTSKLKKLRYFGKYGIDADGVFSTLFAYNCRSFLSLPIDGYIWTVRSDSVSANVTPKMNLDKLRVWTKYLSVINQNKALIVTSREKRYALLPFIISAELLQQEVPLTLQKILIIHKALQASIRVVKKKHLGFGFYPELNEASLFNRCFFFTFPLVWLKRHRFQL